MICSVDEYGYCKRHNRLHVLAELKWSQDPSKEAEQLRKRWDREGFPRLKPGVTVGKCLISRWWLSQQPYLYLRFALAIARHVLAGFPRTSPEDIATRRAICDPCWRRDKVKDECTLCGCRLASKGEKKDLISKLAWAGEKCPADYWGPVAGETVWVRARRWLLSAIGF